MTDGRLEQVNVSAGGVPKLPVAAARITAAGVEGDRQRELTVHGGPHRAVSLLGIEAIRRISAEGHPIAPGTTGENLTTSGFDVSALAPGTRLAIGDDVVLELALAANPCRTIRHSFADLRFGRLAIKANPGDSRMYARVIREGVVRPGDPIRLSAPVGDRAERFEIADRLDAAERESSVAFWSAAVAAGHEVAILDDGEIAAAAAASLPGPVFNSAIGFAHLPNLVGMAVEHFRRNGVDGWVLADEPPWTGAVADTTLARYAIAPEALAQNGEEIAVRQLGRTEVGPWADVIVAASDMPPAIGDAWRDLEGHLARLAHHHRFVVELEGRAVGAGSLHVHHRLGWLRAGSVLPANRGQGIQRALIAHRARHAARLGADLIGASAVADGASAANLERLGFRRVGDRRSYPVRTSA